MPIQDDYISKYLAEKKLNLEAALNIEEAYKNYILNEEDYIYGRMYYSNFNI